MSTSPAKDLADAFYDLRQLEFFHPRNDHSDRREIVQGLVAQAQGLSAEDFHAFSRELVRIVSAYCQNKGLSQDVLYRAFDGLDEVLEIDYSETKQMMPQGSGEERLYEGGGMGVQTSYFTILKVLEHLQLSQNSHLVDLGSGFGRVGLAAGLWREDLQFSGYEFVDHRVAASNASAERAGLGSRIRFLQQDLSDSAFQIPAADAYYLYDPFTASTYESVFTRLSAVSRERKIAVIAKEGARQKFRRWADESEWHAPEALDEGTILLFRSR
jgi:hypothetical protein